MEIKSSAKAIVGKLGLAGRLAVGKAIQVRHSGSFGGKGPNNAPLLEPHHAKKFFVN
jgi:hypothetical protein